MFWYVLICFDIFWYILGWFGDKLYVKDKVKRLILLLNKIRFEKKIKYLVMG